MWDSDDRSECLISMCSLNSQHGGSTQHPVNDGCPNFRHSKFKTTMHLRDTNGKKWKREDNINVINFYFKTSLLQKINGKYDQNLDRMHLIKYKLKTQARMILKKGWFSDLEILEICWPVSHEEYSPEEPLNKLKHKNIGYQNIMEPKTTTSMLTQDLINNVTLPSLNNPDWNKVKVETEKVNKSFKKYPNRKHPWTKWSNLCRSKISLIKFISL